MYAAGWHVVFLARDAFHINYIHWKWKRFKWLLRVSSRIPSRSRASLAFDCIRCIVLVALSTNANREKIETRLDREKQSHNQFQLALECSMRAWIIHICWGAFWGEEIMQRFCRLKLKSKRESSNGVIDALGTSTAHTHAYTLSFHCFFSRFLSSQCDTNIQRTMTISEC